jgi:hypothetical protein
MISAVETLSGGKTRLRIRTYTPAVECAATIDQ